MEVDLQLDDEVEHEVHCNRWDQGEDVHVDVVNQSQNAHIDVPDVVLVVAENLNKESNRQTLRQDTPNQIQQIVRINVLKNVHNNGHHVVDHVQTICKTDAVQSVNHDVDLNQDQSNVVDKVLKHGRGKILVAVLIDVLGCQTK